ncbi:hypothetical protein FA95DRAFT_1594537 [Auriscalpium vulgare]|uniref:Uncharacterized protein n=1 Tax=Auriscalpium vulgare TaxID=40419 RepID=A0ACB8RYV9_9AGAM|nr:hypothetical protein FA95DRAFT_1594537 [Auriscalpium vulgare]
MFKVRHKRAGVMVRPHLRIKPQDFPQPAPESQGRTAPHCFLPHTRMLKAHLSAAAANRVPAVSAASHHCRMQVRVRREATRTDRRRNRLQTVHWGDNRAQGDWPLVRLHLPVRSATICLSRTPRRLALYLLTCGRARPACLQMISLHMATCRRYLGIMADGVWRVGTQTCMAVTNVSGRTRTRPRPRHPISTQKTRGAILRLSSLRMTRRINWAGAKRRLPMSTYLKFWQVFERLGL